MAALIIYAHPQTPGHNRLILEETERQLKQAKQAYEVIDLYKMGFDPVLHENEHYTAGNKDISPPVKEIQGKISRAERMLFIYPIWWGSMPAMLKGFFDKVLTTRFAYKFKKLHWVPFGIPVPFLKGKKAVVIATGGSPWYIFRFYLWSRASTQVIRDILGFCGIKGRFFYFGDAVGEPDKKKARIMKTVRKSLRWLL